MLRRGSAVSAEADVGLLGFPPSGLNFLLQEVHLGMFEKQPVSGHRADGVTWHQRN